MFDAYKECVKEALYRNVDMMTENAELFNEAVKSDIIVTDGWMYELECISWLETNENIVSFWEKKAAEAMELQEKDFNDNEIDGEIMMIEKSSISEELKQKLIDEIKEYNSKRKQNYSILQGRGIKN